MRRSPFLPSAVGVRSTLTTCLALAGALSLAPSTPALAAAAPPAPPRYALIDVGTFGGPQAFVNLPGYPITSRGAVLGTADTTTPDSDFPNSNPFLVGPPDPVLTQAFSWENGKLTNLGALPGNNSSGVFQINAHGVGAGLSENGTLDPHTGYPALTAVLFEHGDVVSLGALPGGHESQAIAINDRGQVAGFGSNGVPDRFSVFKWGTQTRSFVWEHGVMRDIGTLGGPDTIMNELNARGQIAGDSYTDATPNPLTELPTTHPFLWTKGHMRDLGTLGGTLSTTNWLNNRGEVVGQSNIAGDRTAHPFLWDGGRLRDLGTLGGDYGAANHINDAGHVVGIAGLPGNHEAHAFLWKSGGMTDLTGATRGFPCTYAFANNAHDQIVGGTCSEHPSALLWEHGRQFDLNTLVRPLSDYHLTETEFINDQGEIVALGVLPNGQQHLFLLRPTGTAQ
jgi:probable HAF family extracellular repeat protein